jgi:hypothetical protein
MFLVPVDEGFAAHDLGSAEMVPIPLFLGKKIISLRKTRIKADRWREVTKHQ